MITIEELHAIIRVPIMLVSGFLFGIENARRGVSAKWNLVGAFFLCVGLNAILDMW